MIKLFSNKRKKLVSDEPSVNRTANYLKYAIGEIALVMIGILLALQVNTWNEKRKATLEEITILKNIQENILLDTLDISWNIEKHKEFIAAEKKLLYFLQSDLDRPNDSIDYSSALSIPLTIALHKSTYNNLQYNQIGIITNNKLHKDISRFYDFFVDAISMIENDKPVYESYESKKVFFEKYFRLSKDLYEINSTQSNNGDYYNPDVIKQSLVFKDIKGAKMDDAFQIELNESIFIRKVKIDFYTDMLNRIKELSEEINEELEILNP